MRLTPFLYILCLGLFLSCGSKKKASNNEEIEIWTLADRTQECIGEGTMQCLLYKREGESTWQIQYDGVEGFNFEAGNHYRIRVRKEQVENPPADGSSIVYHLVEILEERPSRPIEGVINDTWGVVELNGETVFPGKQEMTIELNTRTNMVNAFAGCNRMGGTLNVLDGDSRSVRIANVFATEMFCEGKMELERQFQKTVEKINRLEFERAELRAFHNNELLFKARRID